MIDKWINNDTDNKHRCRQHAPSVYLAPGTGLDTILKLSSRCVSYTEGVPDSGGRH